ncbi:carbohydrate kinase family protein [Saccharibacillus deserti]|uniref:carbohydrate kinase family protein n=1 Tax=Saccharibacillus deserti TaxID=1634444 RepID=UPI001556CA1F|nr:carbohydrate kinase [Saccharibacillus deserti]
MLSLNDSFRFPEKPNDILTVGELLVDLISGGYGEEGGSDYRRFFGGSPSNIAMNVKKLGVRPVVASAVGEDKFGRFLVRRLEEEGVDTSCVQKTAGSTSLVVVGRSRGTPVPIFYRDADYRLAYTEGLQTALGNSKILHFSCWPVSRTPARGTIERLIRQAQADGTLIGFDPNYHPAIWQEGEDGIEYMKSLIGRADIVKPSEDDAERLFGRDTPDRQLEKFLALGAKLVILTLGSAGALVSDGTETLKLPTLASEVIDTTGAGDAFWSGFYTALIKEYTLKRALMLGFAVSAYKLRHMGAVVDLPKLEEIEKQFAL